MSLHVENEKGVALLLGKGLRLEEFRPKDIEKSTKHRVHGEQGRRHTAGGLEKITASHAKPSGRIPAHPIHDVFNQVLLDGPGPWRELSVGNDLRGHRAGRTDSPPEASRRVPIHGVPPSVGYRLDGILWNSRDAVKRPPRVTS